MASSGTTTTSVRRTVAGILPAIGMLVFGMLVFGTTVNAQPGARYSAGSSGRSHGAAYGSGAAYHSGSVPPFRSPGPSAAVPAYPVTGVAPQGHGPAGFASPDYSGGGFGFPCQVWPYGPGLSINLFYNAAMPVYGYGYSSASWRQVPHPAFGWAAGWNQGFNPWLTPPAMMRNSDGALFFPPVYGPYGAWNGYAPWPGADVLYGIPGPVPCYGVASPIWPGHGFLSSAVGLSVLLNQPLIQAESVPFAFDADGAVEPAQLGDDNVLPPRMRVTPPVPQVPQQPDPDWQNERRPEDLDVPPAPEFAEPEPDADVADVAGPEVATVESARGEFPAIDVRDAPSSMSARLRSLRHQAAGDDAFREQDYQAAQESYQAALIEAGERRAPWLRMAMVLTARQEFEQAAAYLKTGLRLKGDRTRAWITAEELYGDHMREKTREQGLALWEWVGQQPLSTDRLLLAGAFQKLRGDHRTAAELLSLASRNGQEPDLTRALQEIVSDVAQDAPENTSQSALHSGQDDREPASRRGAKDRAAAAAGSTSRRGDGIFLRGRRAGLSQRESAPESPAKSAPAPGFSRPEADAGLITIPETD